MARLIRYKPDRSGMRALRTSPGMDAMLDSRAQAVAAAARVGYAAHGHEVEVEVVQAGSDTSQRARVAVVARHPAAMRMEAKYRILGGSLNAARG